jgi:hypothetical protein
VTAAWADVVPGTTERYSACCPICGRVIDIRLRVGMAVEYQSECPHFASAATLSHIAGKILVEFRKASA